MMPDNQFRELVREMRAAQREYFKTRSTSPSSAAQNGAAGRCGTQHRRAAGRETTHIILIIFASMKELKDHIAEMLEHLPPLPDGWVYDIDYEIVEENFAKSYRITARPRQRFIV